MKKILMILLLAVCVQTGNAQTALVDSLEKRLKDTRQEDYRPSTVDMMVQLANLVRAKDLARAHGYIDRAMAAARRLNYTQGEVQALQGDGVLEAIGGNLEGAIAKTRKSAELAKRYHLPKFEARAYNNLGLMYQRRGEYQEAIGVLLKSVELKKPENDPLELAPTYNNLGVLYKRLANYEQAMEYYLKASAVLEGSDNNSLKADVCNNIGNIAARLKDWDQAIKYNEMSLRIYKQEKDLEGMVRVHTNLGIYYTNAFDSSRGRKHYLLAVKTAMGLGETPALFYAHINLGRYYHGTGALDSSLAHFERANALAHELSELDAILSSSLGLCDLLAITGHPERAILLADSAMELAKSAGNNMILPELYLVKMSAQRNAGNYDEAFKAYADYVAIRDTLYQRERSRQIASLEVQYGLQLTESENIRLQQERELQDFLLREQRDRVDDLERERRLKELELAHHKAELALKEEEQARSRSALAAIEKQRNIERMKVERQSFENRVLTIGTLALGVVAVWMIVLYRRKKQSEESERVKSEELQQATGEILYHQQELEKKSTELSDALVALKERNVKLEELDKEKSEFLAIAAHDLKNPISTIYGLAEIIKTAEPGSQEIEECAEHIVSSTARILTLVSNLLDIEAIDSGDRRLELTAVDISKVISEVLKANQTKAEEKGIGLVSAGLDRPGTVLGDHSTIAQILDNLVSNALKFSPLGSEVTIEVAQENDQVVIEVQDMGPGISAEERANLFKKFSRLSSKPTGGEVSNGLGLYIVARLAASLNGSIAYKERENRGATFVLTLPLVASGIPENTVV